MSEIHISKHGNVLFEDKIIAQPELYNALLAFEKSETHAHLVGSVRFDNLWKKMMVREDISFKPIFENQDMMQRFKINFLGIQGADTSLMQNYIVNSFRYAQRLYRSHAMSQLDHEKYVSIKGQFRGLLQMGINSERELDNFVFKHELMGHFLYKSDDKNLRSELSISAVKDVIIQNNQEGVVYLELRIGVTTNVASMISKIHETIDGIRAANRLLAAARKQPTTTKIIISFKRQKYNAEDAYAARQQQLNLDLFRAVKNQIAQDPTWQEYICGIDVAKLEEEMPPKMFSELFDEFQEYNKGKDEDKKLKATYHVGESYRSISVESSLRHVHEVINFGVNRLGHCIILGIDPEDIISQDGKTIGLVGQIRKEPITERLDQIEYDMSLARIRSDLVSSSYDELESERIRLLNVIERDKNVLIEIRYTPEKVQEFKRRQEYIMDMILEKNNAGQRLAVEVCPTSNIVIGNIPAMYKHPVGRFIKKGIPFTVNTDDGGIFGVNLAYELHEIITKNNLSNEAALQVIKSGFTHAFRKIPADQYTRIERKYENSSLHLSISDYQNQFRNKILQKTF